MGDQPKDRVLMNKAQFCAWSGIPRSTLRDWEKSGLMPPPVRLHRDYYTRAHLRKVIQDGLHRESPFRSAQPEQPLPNDTEPAAGERDEGQPGDGGVPVAM